MAEGRKPLPLALVVCESIYKDVVGRRALIGLFDKVNVASLPVSLPQLCVYFALTEVDSRTVISFKVFHDETEVVVAESPPLHSTHESHVTTTEADLIFNGLELNEYGQYSVRLYYGEEILIERKFNVRKRPGEMT